MGTTDHSAMESSEREIVITRVFNAPRELVFRAWTDPKHVAQWWGPQGFTAKVPELDLHPGGRWRYIMIGPDGTEYSINGVFREVVPLAQIVTTDEFDEGFEHPVATDLPSGIVVVCTFEGLVGKTRLTLRIMHGTTEDRRKHEDMGVVAGWQSSFACLDEHLARVVADSAVDRAWVAPNQALRLPVFESGGGGLVSTVDDYLAFGRMMLNKGKHGNERILSRLSVELMTTDHITSEQKAVSGFFPGFWDNRGWGFGVAEISQRFSVQIAILFMGAARVREVGTAHLTFTASEAIEAARAFADAIIIPLHYEGWAHFSESRKQIGDAFTSAGLQRRLQWMEPGCTEAVTPLEERACRET